MRPELAVAESVLPRPLLAAIRHVFGKGLEGSVLVGGTALAGFYAGHRRSDDIDLFTEREEDHSAACLAVRSLSEIGAAVSVQHSSKTFFRAGCELEGHRFMADVAAAPHLFGIGRGIELPGGIRVAEAETLFAMKGAALVSRAAEKDLYDLLWLLERLPGATIEGLLAAAQRFDAGATAENMLISLIGTRLSRERCDFSLDPSIGPATIHRRITRLASELKKALKAAARGESPPKALADWIAEIRALQ